MKNLTITIITIFLFGLCSSCSDDTDNPSSNPYADGTCSNGSKGMITLTVDGNTQNMVVNENAGFDVTSAIGVFGLPAQSQIVASWQDGANGGSILLFLSGSTFSETSFDFPLGTTHLDIGIFSSGVLVPYYGQSGTLTVDNYKHDGIQNDNDTHFENYYFSGNYSGRCLQLGNNADTLDISIDFCLYGDI